MGREVMPVMARLYESAGADQRADIADMWYGMGWESPEAKRALLTDVHTNNQRLRLAAQWALGRVSSDDDVVEILLGNMQNDGNPLFRDKAACALAYDQIHLSPRQKTRLYEGLIYALNDSKPQVRQIALQALGILTGQNKGFDPNGSPEARQKAVDQWKKWLNDFRANQ